MAIDFQQIYERIKEIGQSVQERQETLEKRRTTAHDLLRKYSRDLDTLRRKVDDVFKEDANLRCAYPTDEYLDTHIGYDPSVGEGATLIASDGSQIFLDRHSSQQYCLINVGGIVMKLNSGKLTDIDTSTQLYMDYEWKEKFGDSPSDGVVALRRDLEERKKLEELAQKYENPIVTFTEGPIELWGGKEDAKAYYKALGEYIVALSRLRNKGIINAGYVDKPFSTLVIRLLEIANFSSIHSKEDIKDYHPLQGINDRWFFGYKNRHFQLLKSGERSAVFAIKSKSEEIYKDDIALFFFYMNVGSSEHPWPVRVEIPKWVAVDNGKLSLLQAVLMQQCQVMGSRPFPYLLHRAHEIAVVSRDEKEQLERMLDLEFYRGHLDMDEGSYKQSAKDLSRRARK